jgi:hypothetical protein
LSSLRRGTLWSLAINFKLDVQLSAAWLITYTKQRLNLYFILLELVDLVSYKYYCNSGKYPQAKI